MDRLWAGWRGEYVRGALDGDPASPVTRTDDCVLCRVLDDGDGVVHRGERSAVILNAYPYTSGHVMVVPLDHVGELEDLPAKTAAELWSLVTASVRTVKAAYDPDGLNVGANLGRAAGAGVPGHLHVHVLPRWEGDTNFMTSVAEARVVPEDLKVTLSRLRCAWPA